MGDFYGQLASISAVLAGFATTFLALLLAHQERSRILSTSIGVTIATAASLLAAALGWALLGSYLTNIAHRQDTTILQDGLPGWIAEAHISLSRSFVVGLIGLFAMLALSGWIRSRNLGIFSTLATLIATITIWGVLRHIVT